MVRSSELRDVDVGGDDVLVRFYLRAPTRPAAVGQKVPLGDHIEGVAPAQGIEALARRLVGQEVVFRVHFNRVATRTSSVFWSGIEQGSEDR
jgi:hypothetical protein